MRAVTVLPAAALTLLLAGGCWYVDSGSQTLGGLIALDDLRSH